MASFADLVTTIPAPADDPSLISSHNAHRGGVLSVCFRPTMKHLVSGGADGSVLMWPLCFSCHDSDLRQQRRRPYRLQGHKGPVCGVAVSPHDTVVASGSKDRTVRLWVPRVDSQASVIKGHSGPVRTVAFSPDGQFLLSGSDDKSIKVWDVETERFIYALVGHLNWVRSAGFSLDGRTILSGSDDKTIRLWDVERRECIFQYTDILGMVTSVRYHPEGTAIASGGSDECIQIWDIRSKALVQHYAVDAGAINSLSFHPSGNFLLSTCQDGSLRVWDLREGQLLYLLKGHEGPTACAEFSKAGDAFASGSSDEQVMIWRSNFADSPGLSPGILRTALQSKHSNSDRFEARSEPEENNDSFSKKQEGAAQSAGTSLTDASTRKDTAALSKEERDDTLQRIVRQLDSLVKTIMSLEKRLSYTETKIGLQSDSYQLSKE